MRSLRWKLAIALFLVAIISIGLMAVLTNQSTTRQFQQYIARGNTAYAQTVAANLEELYAAGQSWDEIGPALQSLSETTNYRFLVADTSGTIVADSNEALLGEEADALGLSSGTAIAVSGQTVGNLYILTGGTTGTGSGGMGRMHGQYATTVPMVTTFEDDFLDQFNTSLWQAGLITIGVALIIGLVLTRQITRPIRALISGVRHITKGDLVYRVKVNSRDEIGELADSFNTMASSLEKTEQSRRQMTADVAHELRTPLTVIEGTVEGILDGVFPPDTEHLQTIKEQSAMLTRLTGDLRDLSLADSGQLKLNTTPTDIADLVGRTVSRFTPQAQGKRVQLTLDPTPVPIILPIDPTRIEQVIANLLTNALRHTPAGGTVHVSVAGESQEVNISVADTGEGIPPEDLPYIFERFYRAGSSRSRKEGGTGLGLAIVKQMVEAHGGKVWAESQPGKGSDFHILLPLQEK